MTLYSLAVTLIVVALAADERAPANGVTVSTTAAPAAASASREMMRFMLLLEIADPERRSRYLFQALLPGLVRDELDLEPLDPRALDVEDLEARAVVLDLVSPLWRAPDQPEDEAADRVVVLDRQIPLELLVEVVDRERAVDPHAPVG